jgi:hypothetical protein
MRAKKNLFDMKYDSLCSGTRFYFTQRWGAVNYCEKGIY